MRLTALVGKCWGMPLALAALAAAGCGPATGTISGKVVYTKPDGSQEVVKGGRIRFTAADNTPYETDIDKDGKYTVEGVPPGLAKASVNTSMYKPNPGAPPPGSFTPNDPNAAHAKENAERYVWIPEKYADSDGSGLTLTVKPGNNPYDPAIK